MTLGTSALCLRASAPASGESATCRLPMIAGPQRRRRLNLDDGRGHEID